MLVVVDLSTENGFGVLGQNLVAHLYWLVPCLATLVTVDSHRERNQDGFANQDYKC